jgi:SRSO17 transposase
MAPARTAPKHQSLLHFVANAPWSDQTVLTKVAKWFWQRSKCSVPDPLQQLVPGF